MIILQKFNEEGSRKDLNIVQFFLLGLAAVVWILLYRVCREVDVFILIEEEDASQPKNLEEVIARSKGRRIHHGTDGKTYEGEIRKWTVS